MEIARFEFFGREDIRCSEDRLAAQSANPGLMENGVGAFQLRLGAGTFSGLLFLTPSGGIRIVELGHGTVQALALFEGDLREEAPIGIKAFEEFNRLTNAVGECNVTILERWRGCHLFGLRKCWNTPHFIIARHACPLRITAKIFPARGEGNETVMSLS
jgi:hypothetical protein